MQAIILAAGKSTRCYPLSITRPKPLLPVANRPILFYHLDNCVGLAKEIILIIGYKGEMIKQLVGSSYNGIPVKYVNQKQAKGTAHALLQAAPLISSKFLVMNGDDIYARDDIHALASHENAVLVANREDPENFGVVEHKGEILIRISEKPKQPKTKLVNAAAYCFQKEFLSALEQTEPSERGELELTSAVNLYAETTNIHMHEVADYWYPLPYAWNLLDANEGILESMEAAEDGIIEEGVTIKGKLIIGKGSVIKAGTYIEGNVLIGENTSVGPNCHIRGSTTIGSNCKLGRVDIKNSIFMDRVYTKNFIFVGDSILGEGTNFGAGTLTANWRHDNSGVKSIVNGVLINSGRRKLGTIVGDWVHTGINTSIYPGRKLWPKVWTLPGEVVKQDIMHQ